MMVLQEILDEILRQSHALKAAGHGETAIVADPESARTLMVYMGSQGDLAVPQQGQMADVKIRGLLLVVVPSDGPFLHVAGSAFVDAFSRYGLPEAQETVL